jgi:hypothetical protein
MLFFKFLSSKYRKIKTLRWPVHNLKYSLWAPIRNMAKCVFRVMVLLIYSPARHVSLSKGSMTCCTTFLYMNRSMLLCIRCNGPTWSREKHLQTLIVPSLCFIVGIMYRTFIPSPSGSRTYRIQSEPKTLYLGSSLQSIRDHCLVVQLWCSRAILCRAFWFFRESLAFLLVFVQINQHDVIVVYS